MCFDPLVYCGQQLDAAFSKISCIVLPFMENLTSSVEHPATWRVERELMLLVENGSQSAFLSFFFSDFLPQTQDHILHAASDPIITSAKEVIFFLLLAFCVMVGLSAGLDKI